MHEKDEQQGNSKFSSRLCFKHQTIYDEGFSVGER
jgi:hypothetical protein